MASEVSKTDAEHVLVECAIHSTESVELYCKDHELALCRICKILKHKKCNLESIADVFQNIGVSEALKEASTENTTLGQAVITSKTEMQSLLDKIIKEKTVTEESIEDVRNRLNGLLDRYKEQLNSQLMSETETLTVTIQACECLSDQIENQKATLEKIKGNTIPDIVSIIEAKNFYKEYHHVTDEMEKETKEVKICIREDDMLPDLVKELTSICERATTESEETTDGVDDKQLKGKAFLDIKSCNAEKEADLKLPDDVRVPDITGCCFSPDDGVIICDYDNKKLKLLDLEMKTIKFTIPCQENPKDVARFDDYSVVVLYGSSFQFTMLKPGIKFQQMISINLQYYAM